MRPSIRNIVEQAISSSLIMAQTATNEGMTKSTQAKTLYGMLSANRGLASWMLYKLGHSLEEVPVLVDDLHSDDFYKISNVSSPQEKWKTIFTDFPDLVKSIQGEEIELFPVGTETTDFLLLALPFPSKEKPEYLSVAVIRADIIKDQLNTFQRVPTYLLDRNGSVLLHTDGSIASARPDIKGIPFIQNAVKQDGTSLGSSEFKFLDGKNKIGTFGKVDIGSLVLVSYSDRDKAYAPVKFYLQTVYIRGAFLFFLTVIVSVVFSNTLTNPLRKLYEATKKIAQGDFNVHVIVKSKDEIKSLADSFNSMAREIISLLAKTAEKAALDKELETASAVQNTLIPKDYIDVGDVDLAGYYGAAAKCGGDWWNYSLSDGRIIVFIADATGHGVSSALVTAAAHSAVSTITHIALGSNFELSPEKILHEINHSIHQSAKGQIMMTFFAAVIDPSKKKIVYSNASHNVPYLIKSSGGVALSKKSISPLSGAKGDICGLNAEAEFEREEVSYEYGDTLVLYTDGLIECTNPQEEQYGKKRLLETFVSQPVTSASELRDRIVSNASGFFADHPKRDDITLVVIGLKKNVVTPDTFPEQGLVTA